MQIATIEDTLNGYGSPFEFENFVITTLRNSDQVEFLDVIPRTQYAGYDAIVHIKDQAGGILKYFLEIKYSSHDRRVSLEQIAPQVLIFLSLKTEPSFSDYRMAIVVNTNLTLKARRYCQEYDIEVWRREKLLNFERNGAQYIAKDYLENRENN